MTENDLLRELTEELTLPGIAPDEITVAMLAKTTGMTADKVRLQLDRRVMRGELVCRWVRDDKGYKAKAYSKPVQ